MKRIIHKTISNGKIVKGTIPVYIKENEYINLYPFTENECEWLEIIDKNINFDTEQIFNINYEIDTKKIKSSYEKAVVVIDEKKGTKAVIEVFIVPDYDAEISKYSYSYNDEGEIIIRNRAENNLEINVSASESYVKFGKSEKTEDIIKLPFKVKVPVLLKTQMEIAAKPYNTVSIVLDVTCKGKIRNKIFNITVGNGFVD